MRRLQPTPNKDSSARRKATTGKPRPAPQSVASHLLRHYRKTARDLPWRRTSDPYAVWVSEIMLQQTQVSAVIPYYKQWMAELPNLAAVARAPLDHLNRLWAGLGYYARPRRFQAAAQQVIERGDGGWPITVEQWMSLPGVGRYTAGAICSIAFNHPAPIVDGNVVRVLSRLWGLRASRSPQGRQRHLWRLAKQLVVSAAELPTRDRRNCADFNQALMELGALVCVRSRPRCKICPLSRLCVARWRGTPERYPAPPQPTSIVQQEIQIWVLLWRNRFYLEQSSGRWNHGLWQFPSEDLGQRQPSDLEPRGPQDNARLGKLLFHLKHSITRYRFHAEVRQLTGSSARRKAPSGGQWFEWSHISALALNGLARKIYTRCSQAGFADLGSTERDTASTTFRTHCSSEMPS